MKLRIIIQLFILTVLFLNWGCMKEQNYLQTEIPVLSFNDSSATNSKDIIFSGILDKYISKGIPGMTMFVYTPEEGLWIKSKGFACIETKTEMNPEHLLFSSSVGKTYCATAIFLAIETGLLSIDNKLSELLPKTDYENLPNGSELTIRQLLKMQSGLPNCDADVSHIYDQINNIYSFNKFDAIKYVYNKEADFSPGTKTAYSSTNYELLALVLEKVSGMEYGEYIRQNILEPLNLTHTFVNGMVNFPNYQYIENAYIDRYSDMKLENFTDFETHKISYLTGSDGVIATMHDYFTFFRFLFNGEILQTNHLNEMMNWSEFSEKPDLDFIKRYKGYGAGLFYVETDYGSCYGHTGDSGGQGMMIYYFLEKDTYIGFSINVTTSLPGYWFELFQRDIWFDLIDSIFD